MRRFPAAALLTVLLLGLAACSRSGDADHADANQPAVSGRVEAGLRVLTVDPAAAADYTIYRGDYVRLETTDNRPVTIVIPDLAVDKTYPVSGDEKAYFKVPEAGSFPYRIGDRSGVITAIDYTASGYREVDAAEASHLIANVKPFILDVRTPGEYAAGHLPGSVLVPLQVLDRELARLPADKDKPVFVYCRSGNRSTVAAKILVDNGYRQVTNLRRGINEWQKAQLPVEK